MASRREILAGGGSGIAMLGLGLTGRKASAAVRTAPADMPPLFLTDTAIVDLTGEGGFDVVRFTGDVGAPWLEWIEPMWRRHPRALAGITYGGAFFCLEQLARSYGLACTARFCPRSSVDAARRLSVAARAGATRQRVVGPVAGEMADRPLAWLLQPLARG